MIELKHCIQDKQGLHARPASALVEMAAQLTSSVVMVAGEKEVDCKKLIAMMRVGAKHGEELLFQIDGGNEEADAEVVKEFLSANL